MDIYGNMHEIFFSFISFSLCVVDLCCWRFSFATYFFLSLHSQCPAVADVLELLAVM